MNWLAHLLLAETTPEARLGHVLADVVPRPRQAMLASGIRAAIAEHAAVDRFTDQHPALQATAARITAPYRRFAGVLADVFYGHCLAQAWSSYSSVPLEAFVAEVTGSMRSYTGPLPEGIDVMLTNMVAEDWLGAYRTVDGMGVLLGRMARRLGRRFDREVELAGATAQYRQHEAAITADFERFMPDLMVFAQALPRRSAGGLSRT